MAYTNSLTVALVLTTILGGTAIAAEQTAQQNSTQMNMADKDVGKLSKDGAQGFRNLQLTRLAIFEANPAQAKDMIGKAQAAFAKAKTDDAQFTKAEADLKTQADIAGQKGMAQGSASSSASSSKEQIAWVPVDAQLTLGDDFVATPDKASAVNEANKNLAQGDQKGALEKLKLAHVEVNFTMAVLPLNKTISDIDQAATMIGQGKYYEANAMLKTAQDRVRFDVIDAITLPHKVGAAATSTPSSQSPESTGTAKTSK
ncbi:hypothetical protein AO398_25530 [Methylobacterium sp. GXS13]|uniref:YfdX family protein n=1 Tax=Methylobacterium sp. GXS13 TaxID=1730094 RepID=UPI00071BD18D|nr:YfdX family protein [Methylobacterium sp. GXS13]KST57272.1 hypothetical protein AO398_25530 [Methylobacterium sp. GXS13]